MTNLAGTTSRLSYVKDKASGTRCLVETSAEVSVIPLTAVERKLTPTSRLRAANGSTIAVYAQRSCTLDLGQRRQFRWIFIVADVQMSIIGIDFLHHFDLLGDARRRRFIDNITQLNGSRILANIAPISPVCISSEPTSFATRLCIMFSSVVRPTSPLPAANDVAKHHICTGGPLTSARARRLTSDKLLNARAEFEHMLELGIIRPSDSLERRHFTWFRNKPVIGTRVATIEH